MKLKLIVFFAAGIIAMGLLLGASAAQAATVIVEGGNATRIENLDVGGTFYNVVFVDGTASDVYGAGYVFDFPGDPQPTDATSALVAVNDALNTNNPTPTGAGSQGSDIFYIGYNRSLTVVNAMGGEYMVGAWGLCSSGLCFNGVVALTTLGNVTWATFTETSGPVPVTIGGSVTGLVGSGLVLQNNGGDDLTITGNGDFEFGTTLTPGDSYNVTVLTNPVGQTCSVTDGSGTTTDADVTAIVVSCVDEPEEPGEKRTILETLCSQDGSQVLCAAIQVTEKRCPAIARLLDRKRNNMTMLAPANEGFEVFLKLKPGTLKGFDVDSIAGMLPGILFANDLRPADVCKLLRRHISRGEREDEPITLRELLQRGTINTLDGSEYPIAIGGGRGGGICVNYESCITERDVFTQNGVIHYLHKVLEQPPVEDEELPSDETPDEIEAWCSRSACEDDSTLHDECVEFLEGCLPVSESDDECWGAALFMCSERDGLFDGDGLFD